MKEINVQSFPFDEALHQRNHDLLMKHPIFVIGIMILNPSIMRRMGSILWIIWLTICKPRVNI